MFSKKLQGLVDIVSAANDRFNADNPESSTVVGVTNETLRAMGDDSDTVSIGCNHSGQRLMFIVKDSIPDKVGIGVGVPETDHLEFLGEATFEEFDVARVLSLIEAHLARQPRH